MCSCQWKFLIEDILRLLEMLLTKEAHLSNIFKEIPWSARSFWSCEGEVQGGNLHRKFLEVLELQQ